MTTVFHAWPFDCSNNTDAVDVKMDGSVLEENSSFKMLGLTFSFKLDWGSYVVSIAKTASKKIGALIRAGKIRCTLVFCAYRVPKVECRRMK